MDELERAYQAYQKGDRDLSALEGYKRRDLAWVQVISKVDGITEREARKKASQLMKRSKGVKNALYRYYHEAMREIYEKRPEGRMRIIEEMKKPPAGKPPLPVTGISELERLREENARLMNENKELIGIMKEYRARMETLVKSINRLEEKIKTLEGT